MAVVIRLRRMGTKKFPYYRIVVTDKRFSRDGRFIETVGTYHPIAPNGGTETLKKERVEYWLSTGAQPSDTVWSILKKFDFKKPVSSHSKKKKQQTEKADTK